MAARWLKKWHPSLTLSKLSLSRSLQTAPLTLKKKNCFPISSKRHSTIWKSPGTDPSKKWHSFPSKTLCTPPFKTLCGLKKIKATSHPMIKKCSLPQVMRKKISPSGDPKKSFFSQQPALPFSFLLFLSFSLDCILSILKKLISFNKTLNPPLQIRVMPFKTSLYLSPQNYLHSFPWVSFYHALNPPFQNRCDPFPWVCLHLLVDSTFKEKSLTNPERASKQLRVAESPSQRYSQFIPSF